MSPLAVDAELLERGEHAGTFDNKPTALEHGSTPVTASRAARVARG